MENPNNVKRSIRIPKEINEALIEHGKERGETVNQIILGILGEIYGIRVEKRRRGRRW